MTTTHRLAAASAASAELQRLPGAIHRATAGTARPQGLRRRVSGALVRRMKQRAARGHGPGPACIALQLQTRNLRPGGLAVYF